MITDPRGRCLLSYCRKRFHEAKLLIEALHDFGVPTWQDLTNLGDEPTEDGLRRAVADPLTSSAVLWITPEVENSPWIRKLEAPSILDRARKQDGFFVVPVCASGVGYSGAHIVVDAAHSLESVPGWNLRRVEGHDTSIAGSPRIDAAEAAAVASRVVRRRIAAINAALAPGEPLVLRASTRTPPPGVFDAALSFDWRHRFAGRHAAGNAWAGRLLPALKTVCDAIIEHAAGRRVVCEGLVPLCGAAALGAAFLQPTGVAAAWRQEVPGASRQDWFVTTTDDPIQLEVSETPGAIDADDLAVLVSINANVEAGFGASRPDLPTYRAVVHVHGPGKRPFHFRSGGEALHAARRTIEAMKSTRERLRYRGTTHVFIAGPAGLAFLIGQLSNQFWPMQTYEFDPEDRGGRYASAALIRRVDAVSPVA